MTKINFRVDSSENFKSANTELSKGEPTLSSSFPYELKVSPSDGSTWDQAIAINPVTEYTPTNINEVFSAGLITFDNNFLYIKTSDGWKQIALVDLGSVVNPPQPPTGPTTTTTTTTVDPSSTTTPDPSSTTTPDPSSTTTTTTPDPSSTTTTTTTTSTTTSTTTTTTLPPASFSTSIFTFGLDEDDVKDDTTAYQKKADGNYRDYGVDSDLTKSANSEQILVDGIYYRDWTFPGFIAFNLVNRSSTGDPLNISISLKRGSTLISNQTSTIANVDDRASFKVLVPLYLRPDFDPITRPYWGSNSAYSDFSIVNGKLRTPNDANVNSVTQLMRSIIRDDFNPYDINDPVEDRPLMEGVFLFADNPDVTLEITTNQYYSLHFADYYNVNDRYSTTLFAKSISNWGNLKGFPSYITSVTALNEDGSPKNWGQDNDREFGSTKTRLKSLPSSIPSWWDSLTNCFSGTSSRLTTNVSSWDTSNIKYMNELCYDSEFNQDISSWNTANVRDFERAFASPNHNANYNFYYTSVFNKPIGSWNTSSVTTMAYMFFYNRVFNQNISSWDTSKVLYMNNMFHYSVFNQDISSWDTSSLVIASAMFALNDVFNQPIGTWDTSLLRDISSMFSGATAFDQVLSNWTLNNLRTSGASNFGYISGFTQANFRDTVIAFDNNTSTNFTNPIYMKFSPVLSPSSDNAYLTAFFSLQGKNVFVRDGDN